MSENPLRARLTRGETISGAWVQLADPLALDIMARATPDVLVIDAQHGRADVSSLFPLIQAASLHCVPVLVRLPSAEPWMAMRALEQGAHGVVVPQVDSPEEAERVVAACRYPGASGVGGGNRSYGALRPVAGQGVGDEGPIVLAMIESRAGLAAVDRIARVRGLDGLFVGPIDLALGLGITGESVAEAATSPSMTETVRAIGEAARAAGVVLAGAALSADHARAVRSLGMQMIIRGADTVWLGQAARAAVEDARTEWAGSGVESRGGGR
jgi:4-hydroxy-2-oxoheptanedioate aldolase